MYCCNLLSALLLLKGALIFWILVDRNYPPITPLLYVSFQGKYESLYLKDHDTFYLVFIIQ